MKFKAIIAIAAILILIYKFISNFLQKRKNNNFVNEINSDNIHEYIDELYEFCGKEANTQNNISQIDAILSLMEKQIENFSILKKEHVDEDRVVVFTRLLKKENIPSSKSNYVNVFDNDYLIEFDSGNNELVVRSTLFNGLEDKIVKTDFTNYFIQQYRVSVNNSLAK